MSNSGAPTFNGRPAPQLSPSAHVAQRLLDGDPCARQWSDLAGFERDPQFKIQPRKRSHYRLEQLIPSVPVASANMVMRRSQSRRCSPSRPTLLNWLTCARGILARSSAQYARKSVAIRRSGASSRSMMRTTDATTSSLKILSARSGSTARGLPVAGIPYHERAGRRNRRRPGPGRQPSRRPRDRGIRTVVGPSANRPQLEARLPKYSSVCFPAVIGRAGRYARRRVTQLRICSVASQARSASANE